MSLYTVKTYFKALDSDNVEIHKFVLTSQEMYSLDSLKERLMKIYPVLKDKAYCLTYLDCEDEVCLESDYEYKFLWSSEFRQTDEVLKIYIKEVKGKNKSNGNNQVKHEGFLCDTCNSEIHGFRYKCLECIDFNLCEKCEGLRHHGQHLMVRLGMPYQGPVHVKTKGKGDHRTFILTTSKSNINEAHSDYVKRKGKEKHCQYCGKRESYECLDKKIERRLKKADFNFPDYGELFNNFIRKYDKFVNPVVNVRENVGTQETCVARCCRETIAQIASTYLNSIFGHQDVSCGGNCSNTEAKEEDGSKSNCEEKTSISKNENDEEKAEGKVTGIDLPATTSQENESNSDAGFQPKSDERNSSIQTMQERNSIDCDKSPDIEVALKDILKMGFSNSDGRLLKLLIENNGDINKVIDILFKSD